MVARRVLVLASCLLACGCGKPAEESRPAAAVPPPVGPAVFDEAELDRFIAGTMAAGRVPGLAVAILRRDGIAWSKGYGWADLEERLPMTVDTLINVGSVSKTFTNAAVLQLWEEGRLDLDADVDRYLPFAVEHPRFPDAAITPRQLLTHTAAIGDGSAYDASYACGDPAVSLEDWLAGYLVPGGAYYREEESFLEWPPGERYKYSNVGFGLLGLVVETVSGMPFADCTRQRIFEPLAMDETSWYLADVEASRHAVPYAWLESGETADGPLLAGGAPTEDGYVAHCLYSFYNYPDGLLRTSVRQLSRFLLAHVNGGAWEGARILRAETVEAIWEKQVERDRMGREAVQGLTWYARSFAALGLIWGHSGGDPGISTYMLFRPEDGAGVIVFANRSTRLGPIAERLFEASVMAGLPYPSEE